MKTNYRELLIKNGGLIFCGLSLSLVLLLLIWGQVSQSQQKTVVLEAGRLETVLSATPTPIQMVYVTPTANPTFIVKNSLPATWGQTINTANEQNVNNNPRIPSSLCNNQTCDRYLVALAQTQKEKQNEYHYYQPTPLPALGLFTNSLTALNASELELLCGSNLSPQIGFFACQKAAQQPSALFKQNYFSQRQPDEYSMAIYSNGFLGIPRSQWVTGSKPPAELSKEELASREKYLLAPWQTKTLFAVIVPPEAKGLIKKTNFKPWQADAATAAQYLNLQLFAEMSEFGAKAHYNLCGPLVAYTVMQLPDLEKFFNQVFHLPWGRDFVGNKDRGLDNTEMENIFVAFDWRVQHSPPLPSAKEACAAWPAIDNGSVYRGFAELCQIRNWLQAGEVPIIDGNLFTSPEVSVLTPPLGDSGTYHNVAHWVAILETIRSQDGFDYVRIYNPYQNREEIYLWNDFYMAWRNVNRYGQYLLAHPAAN